MFRLLTTFSNSTPENCRQSILLDGKVNEIKSIFSSSSQTITLQFLKLYRNDQYVDDKDQIIAIQTPILGSIASNYHSYRSTTAQLIIPKVYFDITVSFLMY